jgi:hypothetical protein
MEEEAPAGDEEAAGPRKRKRGVRSEEEGGDAEADEHEHEKLGLLLLKDDDDDGEEGCYAEEAVAEMMMWLEADISDDDASAGVVTINGNEESCGPSSCAASTVMASVDTRAGAPPPPPVPWPLPDPHFPAAEKKQQEEAETADDATWLDELLLACGPDGV